MFKFICFLIIFSINNLLGCSGETNLSGDTDQNDFILQGGVRFEDNKLSLSENWRQLRMSEEFKVAAEKKETDADIINCSGYLASAKMIYTAEEKWSAVIIPQTISKDAVEKIKLCRRSVDSPYLSGDAFAVPLQKTERKQFNPEKSALQKLFSSLPQSEQTWANCTEILDRNNCARKEEGVLSRIVGDDWADIDGNGEIDLIILKGNCGKTGDYTCSKTLKWTGSNWVEIDYSKPA